MSTEPYAALDLGKNPLLEGLDDAALELVARAEALVPVLAERAEEVDRTGHISPDTFKKLVDAGFIRIFVPKRFGGEEQGMQALMAVAATLGRGCGSTAWMMSIVAGTCLMMNLFNAKAQEEMFGDDPNVGGCASQSNPEKVERVEGGYRVTGRWSYLSGVEHARWALLTIPSAENPSEQLFVAIRVKDGKIEEGSWDVAGMRGTASKTLYLKDYFVPDHMTLSVTKAIAGEPASPFRNERLTNITYGPAVEVGLLASPIGVVQTALEFAAGKAPKHRLQYSTYKSQAQSPGFQIQLAQAATKFHAGRTLTADVVREIEYMAARNVQINYMNRTRMRAMIGYASLHLREAMQILIQAHGTSTFLHTNPLQRMWRDVNVATSHGMVTEMFGYELYGKSLIGSDERLAPLV